MNNDSKGYNIRSSRKKEEKNKKNTFGWGFKPHVCVEVFTASFVVLWSRFMELWSSLVGCLQDFCEDELCDSPYDADRNCGETNCLALFAFTPSWAVILGQGKVPLTA